MALISQTSEVTSNMASVEEDFPRGGTAKKSTESKTVVQRTEVDNLFQVEFLCFLSFWVHNTVINTCITISEQRIITM